MGHQSHWLDKCLRNKDAVERIVMVCRQVFDSNSMLCLNGKLSIPGFRKIAQSVLG